MKVLLSQNLLTTNHPEFGLQYQSVHDSNKNNSHKRENKQTLTKKKRDCTTTPDQAQTKVSILVCINNLTLQLKMSGGNSTYCFLPKILKLMLIKKLR